MSPGFEIVRLSGVNREQEAHHLALARASIALGRKVLADNPRPDTFAGGKSGKLLSGESESDQELAVATETTNVNRDMELRHLSAADAHITHAERVILDQKARVEKLRGSGRDATLATQTLEAFESNLETMRDHRDEIIRTIAQIDEGR